MPFVNLPPNIHYDVHTDCMGITLSIWEAAVITETRMSPFLFKTKYRLASEEDVQTVLNYFLSVLTEAIS